MINYTSLKCRAVHKNVAWSEKRLCYLRSYLYERNINANVSSVKYVKQEEVINTKIKCNEMMEIIFR